MKRAALLWPGLAGILAASFFHLATFSARGADQTVSLAGKWRFQLDRSDVGVSERWPERDLAESVILPGALPAQGIGDDVTMDTKWMGQIVDRSFFTAPEYAAYRQPGNLKVPFWLQPAKYYAGAAWYQRDLEIPPAWQGKRIVLVFERPHWETRVWLDGRPIGTNNSLSTPHEYDLGTAIVPGRHQLTLRVDNRMVVDVGLNSHSVTDHTQGNWNGIVGRMELQATAPVWCDDLQVYPELKRRSARVRVTLGNTTGKAAGGTIKLAVREKSGGRVAATKAVAYRIAEAKAIVEAELELVQDLRLWDEFSPALYEVTAALEGGPETKSATFGFRELATEGTQFVLNGRKLFIRGTLECAIFPLTGHPPTDVEAWKRIVRIAKEHGLNNIRFHSWCPPEAAFIAADELGFYLHVEAASWANSSTTLGDGRPIDQWLYDETDRILRAYGNHPSFLLMPYGNEPGGRNHSQYLAKWVTHYQQQDPRRLYTSGAGWPEIPENQFHVSPGPRIQAWGGGLKSRINAQPPETRADYRDYIRARKVPMISHEIGQWCVYPNFDEIKKYQGYLKPKNFEIFRETLEAHQMGGQARDFLLASGKLQTLCYKEDIESALRTPGMGGFQLLDLHDFPGQGTALVGVLDPFWEFKGYVTPPEYRRFCNSTVPLARLAKRVFTTEENLEASLEVAHFGPAPLENTAASWKLVAEAGQNLSSGKLPARSIPVDNGTALGNVTVNLRAVPAPARCRLVVSLDGTPFENDWDVWIYPPKVDLQPPAGVTVAEELNDTTLAILQAGGKVLLLAPPESVKGDKLGKVALGFSSIFWNTAWTHRQAPHTLGILCDPKHPALARFPTDYHSNWQWWYLVSRGQAMILDGLPAALRPVVQVIDDWFTNRRLGLIFEARVASGKLLVCSIPLQRAPEQNPVARQMLHSLLQYAAADEFKPAVALTAAEVRALFAPPSPLKKYGARVIKTDSEEPDFEGARAIDGDANTMWHTAWTAGKPGYPHEIQIGFNQPVTLRGVSLLPRQDHNKNGWIKEYAVYLSDDGQQWGNPVAKGIFPNNDQRKPVAFGSPRPARFLRLVALSGFGLEPFTSLAELEVVEAPVAVQAGNGK